MKIICAAIRVNGKIYTGKRHDVAIKVAIEDVKSNIITREELLKMDQGFMTDTNEYVNREVAAKIAFAAGQISEPKKILFSEDLY